MYNINCDNAYNVNCDYVNLNDDGDNVDGNDVRIFFFDGKKS